MSAARRFESLNAAVADLYSLSPSASLDGLMQLEDIASELHKAAQVKSFLTHCSEHNVFDTVFSMLSLTSDATAVKNERVQLAMNLISDLVLTTPGATGLVRLHVPRLLCSLIRVGETDDTVEKALWGLTLIAQEDPGMLGGGGGDDGDGDGGDDDCELLISTMIETGVLDHITAYSRQVTVASDDKCKGKGKGNGNGNGNGNGVMTVSDSGAMTKVIVSEKVQTAIDLCLSVLSLEDGIHGML